MIFDFIYSIMERDFECPICFLVMVEPVVLDNCKHKFCIQCLMKSENKTCPLCRIPFEDVKVDNNAKIEILLNHPKEYEAAF